MEIKTVVFDLDGTAIPVEADGMPSDRVIEAVAEAKKTVKVAAATGRPFYSSSPILKKLNLTEPCIVSGGSQIVDPASGSVLWEKYMESDSVHAILRELKNFRYEIYTSDSPILIHPSRIEEIKSERVVYVMYAKPDDADLIVKNLSHIPNISAHTMASWEKGKVDIHITHKSATKKNAMAELLDILGVGREYVMSVGDGGNDLPLFELSGFRVAMGNAGPELKAKADAITLSVSEDGLAVALEKYVINNGKINP